VPQKLWIVVGALAMACVYQKLSVGPADDGSNTGGTGAVSGAAGSSGGALSSGGAGGGVAAGAGTGAGQSNEAGQSGEAGATGPLVLRTLSLLAGQPGGLGSADGLGANARLGSGSLITWDSAAKSIYLYDAAELRSVGVTNGSVTTLWPLTSTTASVLALTLPAFSGSVFMAMSDNTIRSTILATGVETIVAGASMMSGSANGPAADARFNFASLGAGAGITSDGSGTLYLCDGGNNIIRQITGGMVTTVTGKVGVSGHDDGDNMMATFSNPSAIVSNFPYLYVADLGNHTIRRVDQAGNVLTIAGSPGVSGSSDGKPGLLTLPTALALKSGTLFVLDGGAVRSVDLTGNLGLVTLASSAQFTSPRALASDGADSVFISDRGLLRMLTLSTSTVTTLVGATEHPGSDDGAAASASFNRPAGVTADANGHVFVADSSNGTIRSVDLAQATVSTLAGMVGTTTEVDGVGTDAHFALPVASAYAGAGLVTDTADHLFVADSFGSTIRQIVVSARDVSTLAGMSHAQAEVDGTGVDARFAIPTGIARDGDKLYITDSFGPTVRELDADGKVTTLTRNATAADGGSAPPLQFSCTAHNVGALAGIAADGSGNLYFSDCGYHVILKLVIDTRELSVFAGSIGDPGTDDGIGDAARFETPMGIASDGKGNLYVADGEASTLRKIVIATAQVTTIAGQPNRAGIALGALPGGLNTPTGVAVLPDGSIVVSDATEHSILLLH
jgi:hypothetical protein